MTVSIVAARRTPIGTAGHGLGSVPVAELAAAALPAVLADALLTADQVAEVVLGNCTGPGGDLARYAALLAGLGSAVPGLTVDRQCGSGLAAVTVGAALVSAGVGADRVVLAGGVESASTSSRPGRAPFAPPELGDPEMGEAADHVARLRGVSRRAAGRVRVALPPRGRGRPDGGTSSTPSWSRWLGCPGTSGRDLG